jgi:hypothetical protein
MTRVEIIRRHPIVKISRGRDRDFERMRQKIESLRLIQWPFGWVFWALEQRIAHIADELERRRT